MDGLLAVLRLKWVAWAMYLHPYYIVLNPSGSQAPHPVNFEMSAVALPIGAVMFSFSEESALNGPLGQWVNPSALLHSSHAEPSTRPVCRVLFVLCPILPMDLGPQRCSRFKQPVRRRLTFGPSEGSACTSRPWVRVMTTQIRSVPVCACVYEIFVPCVRMHFRIFCAHAFLNYCAQLCACSLFKCAHAFFTSSNHISWFACLQGPSLCFRSLEGRLLSKLLCCLFVDSWLLDFSACQMRCPDLLNLLTRWSRFCLSLNEEFLIGVRQELCMKEVWKSWSDIGN